MDGPGAAEQRLADALRARAVTGGYPGMPAPQSTGVVPPAGSRETPARATRRRTGPSRIQRQVLVALLVALLAGLVFGVGLALTSMLVPGLLPAFG
jgi:hypothetical protein